MAKTLYASVDELRTYATDRAVSLQSPSGVPFTDDEVVVFLVKAQDYIDLVFEYKGEAINDDSEFPRKGLDKYDETTVPPAVRKSTMYVACHLIEGLPVMEGSRAESEIKREVVAANRVETEYATNYNDSPVQGFIVLDAPLYMLRRAGLIKSLSGFSMNMKAIRG